MPAINFEITWPDGETKTYYSPSTIIRDHLQTGDQFTLDDFNLRIDAALNAASERVREKFGYSCSAAADELAQIKLKLNHLRSQYVVGKVLINKVD